MKNWVRATDPRASVAWLDGLEDALTGYWAPPGYADSTWILHAMYQNEALAGLGTHDDVEKDLVGRGLAQPDVVSGIDLTASTMDTGTPLGFVERPGPEWSRLRWRERFGPSMAEQLAERSYPPNDLALRTGASWSASIAAPPEGSMDEASLMALVDVLATITGGAQDAPITAFYGEVPANDYEQPTAFTGPLGALRELTDTLDATPSNLWPADRSWFVLTDWDITSTGIWGTRQTIDAVRRHPDLETIDWTRGATS
ncbi:hypothetical protein [Promicromonospora sukumoe]|uniref:Uncharacterized protein n=1 Tax=Promicromonospora sukumoe TaxID=88382 RepID=A0A7W3JAC3_9MICO|nr:hypothetical protein [Promicromonospora sukumoe]MBA8809140.1 hypothetical protein [Promicromonospora sukumoe]